MRTSCQQLQHGRLGTVLLSILCRLRKKPSPSLLLAPAPLTKASQALEEHSWIFRNRINILMVTLACAAALTASVHLMTPGLAETLADGLPSSWVRTSSEQVLGSMENSVLSASQTPLAEQEALRDRFAAMSPAPEGTPPYRLLFRHSNTPDIMLMNLPGGEIIVTDQFLQSVPDQTEQLALLCHELGHLYYRHALRNAIEHNLYWLASAALIGSSEGSIHALARGLQPIDYTREHVLEADRYALSMLHANGLSTRLMLEAIEHGQAPISTARAGQDPLSHRQYFKDRISALQNLL